MAFIQQDEKELHYHRLARIGLLLSCLPLLCAMLGMPLLLEKRYGMTEDMLIPISHGGLPMEMLESGGEQLVPKAWLKSKTPVAGRCEFEERPKESSPSKIRFIRVIGERNSGVDAVAEMMGKLFPNVTVGTGFVRGKYWFQAERILKTYKEKVDLDKVLVVVVLKNPYDWLRSLRKNPLHAPNHVFRHDWRMFLTKPWTLRTSSIDKEISKVPGVKCQAKYLAGEVLPCRQSRFNMIGLSLNSIRQKRNMAPVYEMNPLTGLPFSNLLQLRKHKLLNYANMTTWVPRISFIKVENLATAEGVEKLRTVLRNNYNLAICKSLDGHEINFVEANQKRLITSTQETDFLNCNLDWSAERLFGYEKRSTPGDELQGKQASDGQQDASAGEGEEEEGANVDGEGECPSDAFAKRYSGRTYSTNDVAAGNSRNMLNSHSIKWGKSRSQQVAGDDSGNKQQRT